jgi:addiction module RelB/DinJ family antitoxin
MSSTIQVRVDSKTKQSVTKIFAKLGLDVSAGVKIYFQQVLREKGIPFPLLTENGFTPEQEKKLLAEVKKTRRLYAQGKLKTYASAKELFKELES